jgi:hypothetical protein
MIGMSLYSIRPAPRTMRGPAHVGIFIRRPASPIVRANNVRRKIVAFFNSTPNYVNLSAGDRIRLRAEFEQMGVTKTQLHKLAEYVLDIRIGDIASHSNTNAPHLHEVEFWAWLSIVTRRSGQSRPSPRTLVQQKLAALLRRTWNPWTDTHNPLFPKKSKKNTR